MESLPIEVLDLIARDFAYTKKKAPYATVSKKWQLVIERSTFCELYVQSHELADFKRILSTASRRSSLARLHWRINLPQYPRGEHGAERETVEEQQVNDQVFTKYVVEIISELSMWEVTSPSLKNAKMLKLDLSAMALSPGLEWGSDLGSDDRVERSLLRLKTNTPLPIVERPVAFHVISKYPRKIEGYSTASIARAFANLEQLNIQLYDGEKENHQVRQQHRYDMAKELEKIQTQSLTWLLLEVSQNPTLDEDFAIPSALHVSDPSRDHLSEAIHKLSRAPKLRYFDLWGWPVLSKALLWPSSGDLIPNWPNLEYFNVEFDMKTPEGTWYYLSGGTPGNVGISAEDAEQGMEEYDEMDIRYLEDDEIEERTKVGEAPYRPTRNIPDKSKLVPFFKSVAQAAAQMPKLRFLNVKMRFSKPGRSICEITFGAPGVYCKQDERVTTGEQNLKDLKGTYRLFWNAIGLDLDEDCLTIWRDGERQKGRELDVHILKQYISSVPTIPSY